MIPEVQTPTNIWALEKSPRLKALLILLVEQLGREGMVVDEQTETVDDGVWLRHPFTSEVRAYVYVHGQEEGRAGVHLEYPKLPGVPAAFEHAEDMDPRQLAEILAAHFDVSCVQSLP